MLFFLNFSIVHVTFTIKKNKHHQKQLHKGREVGPSLNFGFGTQVYLHVKECLTFKWNANNSNFIIHFIL